MMLVAPVVCADVFSSLERLRALMDFERELPSILETYVEKETERLQQMKILHKSLEESVDEEFETETAVKQNVITPSGAVSTVDRLVNIWQPMLSKASNFTAFLETKGKVEGRFNDLVPSDEDLRGAYMSFVRLQEVYKLDAEELVRGKIKHQTSSYRMDENDCYNLALASMQRYQFEPAIRWLDQGLELVEEGPVWEQMARLLGDMLPRVKGPGGPPQGPPRQPWREDYEALCRGEKVKKNTTTPPEQLYCTYRGHGIPYAPWKEEIVNIEPLMIFFHDFITDAENLRIREEAFPSLARAQVGGQADSHVSDVRVGRVSWLYTHVSELSTMLTKRTEDATGLECMENAESYQIGNYGMGGHYEPHMDSDPIRFSNAIIEGKILGDRVATLMIYLSEVEAGGSTVFPLLGHEVKPIRNAAIFWYNLKKSGEIYPNSLHGACPVLLGNKWVANKWIHELGQTFHRPCGLTPNEESDHIGH